MNKSQIKEAIESKKAEVSSLQQRIGDLNIELINLFDELWQMEHLTTIKGWTGDREILEHLDRHGVLDHAAKLEDEDTIGPGISMDELRERYYGPSA